MNNRIFSMVLFATLLTVSSGCCNMSKMFFGRGARCGMCTSNNTAAVAPPATYAAPQPYMAPVASAPVQMPMQTPAPMQAPAPYQGQVTYQGQSPCCNQMPCQSQPAPQPPRKSCFLKDWFGHKRKPAPQPCGPSPGYQNAPCYSCYGSESMGGYGSMGGSQSMGGCGCGTTSVVNDPYTMQPGQVIENGTVIQGDGFSARRFDSDGARIIWEQPSS